MFLTEFLAPRTVPEATVRAWGALAFGLPEEAVVVAPEKAPGAPLGEETELLVEIGEAAGDFPVRVMVFPRSERAEEGADEEQIVALFARTAGVTVLASDDSVLSPYRMVAWSPEGTRTLVALDERALDEDEAYVVSRAAPGH